MSCGGEMMGVNLKGVGRGEGGWEMGAWVEDVWEMGVRGVVPGCGLRADCQQERKDRLVMCVSRGLIFGCQSFEGDLSAIWLFYPLLWLGILQQNSMLIGLS